MSERFLSLRHFSVQNWITKLLKHLIFDLKHLILMLCILILNSEHYDYPLSIKAIIYPTSSVDSIMR